MESWHPGWPTAPWNLWSRWREGGQDDGGDFETLRHACSVSVLLADLRRETEDVPTLARLELRHTLCRGVCSAPTPCHLSPPWMFCENTQQGWEHSVVHTPVPVT